MCNRRLRIFKPNFLELQARMCYTNQAKTSERISRYGKDTPLKFNEKIYHYRKKLGISQEALAERLSISRQAVSKWETGEAAPDSSKLLPLAEMFGVSVDHLLKDKEPENISPPTNQIPDSSASSSKTDANIHTEDMPKQPFFKRMMKKHGYAFGAAVLLTGILLSVFGIFLTAVSGVTFVLFEQTDDIEVRPAYPDNEDSFAAAPAEPSATVENGTYFSFNSANSETPRGAVLSHHLAVTVFTIGLVMLVCGNILSIIGIILLIAVKKSKMKLALKS